MSGPDVPKAVLFDVFGTLVDWRGSIALAAETAGIRDGEGFADVWRSAYRPSMDRVRTGALPWRNLDELHRASLDELLPGFGAEGLDEMGREALVQAWHRLTPWPDSVTGLVRLKALTIIGPLSNGHLALQVELAKAAGFPWDVVLGADLFRHYKPDPQTYLGAAGLLGFAPGEVMLAACHNDDLAAARRVGLRTAFIPRPLEWGVATGERARASAAWDIVVDSVVDLAIRLGG